MDELTPREIEKLKLWEKRMIISFLFTISGIPLLVVLNVIFKKLILEITGGVYLIVSLTTGVILQLSEKCPKCGYRIGFSSRLFLPPFCPKCRVKFKN